jgi:hypothetical protein
LTPFQPLGGSLPGMTLEPPDLSSTRRLLWLALGLSVLVAAMLLWRGNHLDRTLGDTDDAMRLVMVRDLLAGRGWFDQHVWRLQPPYGIDMHWSRLVDAGIAGLDGLLHTVMGPAQAERAARQVWPLLWIFPAVLGALVLARRIGGAAAVFVAAVLSILDVQLYAQFLPGRVDHHDIQITLAVAAAAMATTRTRRSAWAVGAGLATALGLAVGIETLAFLGFIGAAYGLRFATEPEEAGPARAYGLSLAGGTTLLFLAQTPPARWGVSACDALTLNLIAGVLVAGAGLAVATLVRGTARARWSAVAAAGALALAIYLLLDPACVSGPFGSVDPRLKPFWFDHIQELASWPVLYGRDRAAAVGCMVLYVLDGLAVAWLLWRERRTRDPATLLLCALLLLAVVTSLKAYRMQDYASWFGAPAIAAAVAGLMQRYAKGRLVPLLVGAIVLAPSSLGAVAIVATAAPQSRIAKAVKGDAPGDDDRCADAASYARLARLPRGLVLGEVDLGSYVLAYTPHSALSAPYHRMNWGIWTAHDALASPEAQAEAKVHALKATYVADCTTHRLRIPPGGLGRDLRNGRVPPWLNRLSAPGEVLQVYAVEGAGQPSSNSRAARSGASRASAATP